MVQSHSYSAVESLRLIFPTCLFEKLYCSLESKVVSLRFPHFLESRDLSDSARPVSRNACAEGSQGTPRDPLPSSSLLGTLRQQILAVGAGMGGALGKGLSEPCGFESQVSIELECHHGKIKVWKHSG